MAGQALVGQGLLSLSRLYDWEINYFLVKIHRWIIIYYSDKYNISDVVVIATGYGLDGPGIESRWGRDFPHLSKPTVPYATWQRPTTARPTTFHVCKTRDCLCSFRLLMMGGVSPETCWASFQIRNNKILIHCCILLGFFTVRILLWCTDQWTSILKTQLITVNYKCGDMFRLIESSSGQLLNNVWGT